MQLTDLEMLIADSAQQQNIPGLSIAITDDKQILATYEYGYANRESKEPVRASTRFEFGSIGKSFTAIALLQLVESGVLDLHKPLAEYLDWFELPSDYDPITPHHLLFHSAGIITGSDFSGEPWFEVYALRETRPAAAPGTHFHYSNIGYKALGLLLETLTGKPYRQVIYERILEPLGMRESVAWVTHAQRAELATGYFAYYNDRPMPPHKPLAPATWLETATADGCIIATATDLAIYARMLMNGGAEGILSAQAFQEMITPQISVANGSSYGYGLRLWEQEGHRYFGHSGGMVGYSAQMTIDPESNLAVTIMANSDHTDLEPLAHALLHRYRTGETRFAVVSPPPVDQLQDCCGLFVDEKDQSNHFSTTMRDGQLWLSHNGQESALERHAPDSFVSTMQPFDLFLLTFERTDDGVTHALCGAQSFRKEGAVLTPAPDYPAEWDQLVGHYRSYNPWAPGFRVIIQRGKLLFVYPQGDSVPLTQVGEHTYRIEITDPSPETVSFDTPINHRMLRAKTGGGWYYRTFTV
jgi:CubicO group peptidase (beta-lactamase class C family)